MVVTSARGSWRWPKKSENRASEEDVDDRDVVHVNEGVATIERATE